MAWVNCIGKRGTPRTCLLILGAALWPWGAAGQVSPPKADAGKVTSHSQGLHGYIGFGHEKLPPAGGYHAGMGFYAAVWPLVDEPLADFQIGLTGLKTLSATDFLL